MTTHTARVIIEGGIDWTTELTDGERAQIILIIQEARERNLEEQRQRDAEERARRRREETSSVYDEAFQDPVFEDVLEQIRRMTQSFPRGGFSWGATTAPRATPTPTPPLRPSTPRTEHEAHAVLKRYAGDLGHGQAALRSAIRRAKRKTHPDTGGAAADFQLVTVAEAILRTTGHI